MLADQSQPLSPTDTGHRAGHERVRLKSVAWPVEHGGWGMLGEPLLLGLLVAPSWAGLAVGMAATCAFLARHPLKLAVADWRAGRRNARTIAAERFALAYGSLGVASLALASRGGSGWWIPLAAAAPLALLQLAHDARNQGRQLLPELLGGLALGSVAAAELLAAGWDLAHALAAWGLMAVKAASAILYVRARLRCDRGLPFSTPAVTAIHVLGIAGAAALAALRLGPWLAVAAFAVLSMRAAHGVSRFHRKTRPQAVGLLEMAYGLGFVLLVALGYRAG